MPPIVIADATAYILRRPAMIKFLAHNARFHSEDYLSFSGILCVRPPPRLIGQRSGCGIRWPRLSWPTLILSLASRDASHFPRHYHAADI